MSAEDLFRYALALVAVIALVVAVSAAYRFLLPHGPRLPRVARRDRRLKIVEMMPIDSRRHLVLIRRDQTEHLVLLFPDRGVVIETDIAAIATAAAPPPPVLEPEG